MMIAGYSILKVALICAGVFLASFVDAIGGGGGLISLPTYLLAGLPTHFALGTNKLSSCLGTTASTVRYIKNGYINVKLAIPSAVLAVIGAHFGTSLQLRINGDYLKYLLIPVLIFAAAVMLKKKEFPEEQGDIEPWKMWAVTLAASLLIGAYDGFYGPGAGTFMLLIFCRMAKMDLRTASGNVKVVNLSSNVGALVTSIMAGKVIFTLGLISAVFAFLGQFLGAGVMMKNGSKIVTPVILAVLTLLFVKIVSELLGFPLLG